MGYTTSKFFIVYTHSSAHAEACRALALGVFAHAPQLVGPVMHGVINNAHGFMIWTSGSKDGWLLTRQHDTAIEELIDQLALTEAPSRWCLVEDGEEPGDVAVVQGDGGDWTHKYTRHIARRRP